MTFEEIQLCVKGSAPSYDPSRSKDEWLLLAYLGKEDFFGLADFFLQLFFPQEAEGPYASGEESAPQPRIIALITRRCFMLAQAYISVFSWYAERPSDQRPEYLQGIPLEKLGEIVERSIVTDSALVAMSGQLADMFLATGKLPRILIADELIEHGQAMNSVLSGVEERVRRRIEGMNLPPEKIQRAMGALSAALELYVYAQNSKTLLLYPRYQKILRTTKLCKPAIWRALSKNITTALAVADRNDTAASWSLRIKADLARPMEAAIWAAPDEKCGRQFIRMTTGRSFYQVYYLYFYPDTSKPRIMGSVSVKKSAATGDLLLVPTVLFEKNPLREQRMFFDIWTSLLFPGREENFISVTAQYLDESLPQEYARWLTEVNLLALERWMLSRWTAELEAETGLAFPPIALDAVQTAQNFTTLRHVLASGGCSAGDELEKLFFSAAWETEAESLTSAVNGLLSAYKPVWTYGMQAETEGKTLFRNRAVAPKVDRLIENVIARIGLNSEQTAHELYISGLSAEGHTFTKASHRYSLYSLFWNLFQALDDGQVPYEQYFRYYVVLQTMQLLDMGTIDIEPTWDEEDETCYMNVHAGEQAVSILPARYEPYILALLAIQKNCSEKHLEVSRELHHFMENLPEWDRSDPDLEADLLRLMESFTVAGQSFREWSFPMATCSTQLNKKLGNARNAMIDMISAQFRYLSLYQKTL